LRRWADQGTVETWTTPGGHRRFDRAELERLAEDRRRTTTRPLASLGATPERLRRAYRRRYNAEATGGSPDLPPGAPRDDDERAAYRRDGRRLVETMVVYLDAGPAEASRRERIEAEANAIVDDLARLAAGASMTEAVALFVAARQPFLTEIGGVGRRRSLDPARLAALYDDASALLDRLLMRFIAAHQAATSGARR
jgi:DNA-binding transcriptional MerR regulator